MVVVAVKMNFVHAVLFFVLLNVSLTIADPSTPPELDKKDNCTYCVRVENKDEINTLMTEMDKICNCFNGIVSDSCNYIDPLRANIMGYNMLEGYCKKAVEPFHKILRSSIDACKIADDSLGSHSTDAHASEPDSSKVKNIGSDPASLKDNTAKKIETSNVNDTSKVPPGANETSKVSPVVNDTSKVSPGANETSKVSPVVNDTSKVSPGANETSKVSPVVNDTSKVSPGANETSKVSPVVNDTSKVSPGANETSKVSPVVNDTSKVSPGSNETSKVSPVVNDTSKVSPGANETSKVSPVVNDTSKVSPGANETSKVSPVVNDTSKVSPGANETSKVSPVVNDTSKVSPGANDTSKVSPGANETSKVSSVVNGTSKVSFVSNEPSKVSPVVNGTNKVPSGANETSKVSPVVNGTSKVPGGIGEPDKKVATNLDRKGSKDKMTNNTDELSSESHGGTADTLSGEVDKSESKKYTLGAILTSIFLSFGAGILIAVLAKMFYNRYRKASYALPPDQGMQDMS